MKIRCFGAMRIQDQLPRIIQGFESFGHEILNEESSPYDCDLVYVNDPAHIDEAWNWYGPCSRPLRIIFNVQDIPHHIPNFDLEGLRIKLKRATHVTSISKTTQNDVKTLLGIDSTVIYQPAMLVFQIESEMELMEVRGAYQYKYLIVGRNSDSNKRNDLLLHYFHKFEPNTTLAVVGSEPWRYGDYFGIVSNEMLNHFYNSVEYVFSLTKYGGIELSQIEAILAGKFPIVANDSAVALEFNPEFACEPTPEGIHAKILEIEANSAKYKEIVKQKQALFQKQFSGIEVARKILELVK